jgi:hypothetical protein
MSNRNFDASQIPKRIRDKNIAQQLYTSFINGKSTGNTQTINSQSSIITTEYYPGVQTTAEQSLRGSYSFDLGGIANYFPLETVPVKTVPVKPTITSITPGNTIATVIFTAGFDGGSPIINYLYALDSGSGFGPFVPAGTTTSPFIITGLTNGLTYQVKIKAVNAIGESSESAAVSVTPFTIPSAPTITSIIPGNTTATIIFTAGFNGGSAITDYKYSTNNGASYTSAGTTTSPITITGLTNGTSYQVKIRAVNAADDGVESNMVLLTMPVAPSAPTNLVGTSASGQVSIAFTPGSNGGSAITDYKYSIDNGAYQSTGTATSPITISSLTNGRTYSFKIRAVNVIGDSAESTSILITPLPGSGLIFFLDAANYTSGTTWPESSGKNMNSTLVGSPIWSSSNGGRFEFNGLGNQNVALPAGFNNFSSGITILSFVHFGGVSNNDQNIIGLNRVGPADYILLYRINNTNDLSFEIVKPTSDNFYIDLINGITDNTWSFYGAKADGTNFKVLNQITSNTASSNLLPNSTEKNNNIIAVNLQGYVSIVAVYNTPVSDADITAFYNTFKSRFSLS